MSVSVNIDTSQIGNILLHRFEEVTAAKSEVFREVALDLIPMIAERIHVDGKAADGSQIGTYSDAYMKVRTGDYGNADKVTRGRNAGKNKNAGVATRGASKGSARVRYNRSAETKKIISLTRQLENDYAVMPGEIGWGIGFQNAHNAEKALWNNRGESGAIVYDLTEEELAYAVKRSEELITADLNK